jgi:hypothetical protein
VESVLVLGKLILNTKMFNSKFKAFLVHLAISATIVAVLVYVAMRIWFPMPYFVADGGWQGIRLVACVDAVLGPCLTLVVYNRRKSQRAMALDYAVIGLLQLGALGFGIWTVFSQRTVMVVLAEGTFYSVDAETATRLGDRGAAVLSGASTRPTLALIDMPRDLEAQQELRRESLSTGRPLYLFSELLVPLDAATSPVLETYALDSGVMVADAPPRQRLLQGFLETQGGREKDFLFLPVICRYRNFVLVFARGSAVPHGWLNIPITLPFKRRQGT